MRATRICGYGDRDVEVFVEPQSDRFELWLVTAIDGARTVINHYVTSDDLESRLIYATRRPLTWRDALRREIPKRTTPHVDEWERTVRTQKIVRFDRLSYHFIALPPWDTGHARAARKTLLGTWRGNSAVLELRANDEAIVVYRRARFRFTAGQEPPDRWRFSKHGLYLLNEAEKTGAWVRVLHVDDRELHLWSLKADRLADVFVRVHA